MRNSADTRVSPLRSRRLTISPTSPLPDITDPLIIDGYTQHGSSPNTLVNGYFAMGGGQSGGCCDNDVHEIFKCLGEIALTSAYVLEHSDGSLETWNCTAQRDGQGGIEVTPAEAVVARVHFNLSRASRTKVKFTAGVQTGDVDRMSWFGPGGIPEELR